MEKRLKYGAVQKYNPRGGGKYLVAWKAEVKKQGQHEDYMKTLHQKEKMRRSVHTKGGEDKVNLTIGSHVSVRSSRYEARRNFGEHERCARVARGVAEGNSSFLSALQTSQVLHISMNAQMMYRPIVL